MTLDLSLIQQQMDQLMADHSEQNRAYYDLFFNPVAKDVALPQYVNGVLSTVNIPNRAKMIDWYGKGLNPPVRQSVLQGKTNAATGEPAFLNAVGTQVEVDASPDGLLLAFAAGYTDTGPLDYIVKVSQDVNVPGLTANATNHLYAERNAASGAVTFGATTLAPAWQATAPVNPQAGQHWFDPIGMVMKVWDGAAWSVKQRLFIGTAVTDAGGAVTVVKPALFHRGDLQGQDRGIHATITQDTTLNVPVDFATIQAALDCLADKTIAANATVTIQVADGNYAGLATITVGHRDGDRIQIKGNTANPSACNLTFAPAAIGFIVRSNVTLTGFTLTCGGGTPTGILVKNGASLNTGDHAALTLVGWGTGLYAAENSFVSAPYSTYVNCNIAASANDSVILVSNSAVTAAGGAETAIGFEAVSGGVLIATQASLTGPGSAQSQSRGTVAYQLGMVNVVSATVSGWGSCLYAIGGGFILATFSNVSNCATALTPAANTSGNSSAFISTT